MTEQPQPPADVANDPSLVQVYDKIRSPIVCHQRNVTNRRAARNEIRSNWDNPSQLYNVIVAALNDGFRADILKATEQI